MTPFAPILTLGGPQIRAAATVQSLAADFDVTVVCTGALTPDEVHRANGFCRSLRADFVAESGGFPRRRPGRLGSLAVTLMRSGTAGTEARSVDRLPPNLVALIESADLLWVFRLEPFMHHHMPVPVSGRVVIDVDELDERVAGRFAGLPAVKRAIRRRTILLIRRRLLGAASAALLCSPLDAERFAAQGLDVGCPVRVLPNTYPEPTAQPVERRSDAPTVVFIGRMGYRPNREGASWLMERVWPQITRRCPTAVLVIAGVRSEQLAVPPGSVNVRVLGEVDEVGPLIGGASVVVVPIHDGSGTRVKILEAFAYGVPVVSTTIGAEGIDAVDGESILIADDPDAFAQVVVRLLDDRDLADTIARAGRAVFDERYSMDAFGATVRQVIAGVATK